ncbi:STAM-binding protein-like A [Drosophila guanche]|uniref:Blast:STAM-binding protein n=1 Tax=Drosophila guanche TaxID=7266 RepID=A0A3B0K3A1_DROGU|nr:STAM-binding protein-like A [Drosophila guanche]SPP80096.1 blast:STAM-binding protein [Drosophila guanche]
MSKAVNHMSMGVVEPQERMKHLSHCGNLIDVDKNQPVTRYYRSGTEMLRMANVYLQEGNHENAFILYLRYMTLFIEKIRQHPDYANVKAEVRDINKRIKDEIMPTTEKLRAKLLAHYQSEYEQFLANKEAERVKELERERERERQRQREQASRQPAGSSSIPSLIPANLHVLIDEGNQPSAPDLDLLDQVVYPNDFPTGANRTNLPGSGLLLPTADKASDKTFNSKPSFDRNQKPSYNRTDSLLAGSLRIVHVPGDTMEVFLQLAKANTSNNIETCGVLAGHLAQNQLYITHIITPQQQGTPDSCNTMHEEQIFDVQDQMQLITLGWIHTHPSQTAFLSSVDLHTHCSYQMMMPEALAIVCAPKYNTTGFFILTPHYGLDYIAQCRQSGFHPHPNDPPLFMEAQHIQKDVHTKIKVIDLRR